MNSFLPFQGAEWWQIAGWTMLHFLWLGTLAGLAAMVCRLFVRRASAEFRYAAALVSLALLAALPLGIAVWLSAHAPGEIPIAAELPQADEVIELHDRTAVPTSASAPGSAEGLLAPNEASQVVPSPSVIRNNPRQTSASSAQRSRWLMDVFTTMPAAWVPYLPWLWLVGTPLTFVLLTTGIVGAERLRRDSRVIDDGPIVAACARLRQSLGVSRRVAVAVCERIAAPVLVGILRPIILLPPAALTGWSPDEIEMVLLHELAHVRRWDNPVNLVQRLIESLLFFHPAIWLVSGWVRREREACCDAVVVHRTNRPHAYAEMLVALAAQMPRSVLFHPAATSAMAAGPLRTRIRRILQLEDDPMLVSRKFFGAVLCVLIVLSGITVFYVSRIVHAEEPAAQNTSNEVSPPEKNELGMGDMEMLTELFSDDVETNPIDTRTYAIPDKHRKSFDATLSALSNGPLSVVVRFKYKWNDRHDSVEITAPRTAQIGFFAPLIQSLGTPYEIKLSSNVATLQLMDRPSDEAKPSATKPSSRFPSLEDQKLADLAWKMLQLELEPINDEEMKRVKAMGYDGGVKVVKSPRYQDGIAKGDILLGLHVWPTTSLKDVADVLSRDDLDELNPLKFYVQRLNNGAGENGQGEASAQLVTGRLSANTGGSGFGGGRGRIGGRGMFRGGMTTDTHASVPAAEATAVESAAPQSAGVDKSSLRYDGKPFSEWREIWRNELSNERRLEAVKALAAFGRAGYGKEAAESILDVASNYDFRKQVGRDSSEGQLRGEMMRALASGPGIDPSVTFSMILDRYAASPEKWHGVLVKFLSYQPKLGAPAIPQAQKFLQDENSDLRAAALAALHESDPAGSLEAVSTALGDPESLVAAKAIEILVSEEDRRPSRGREATTDTPHMEFPTDAFVQLLLRTEVGKRNQDGQLSAFGLLQRLSSETAETLVGRLTKILNDPSRASDQITVVRALRVLNTAAVAAVPDLERIFNETQDMRLRVAAAYTLDQINQGNSRRALHYRGQVMDSFNRRPSDEQGERERQEKREEVEKLLGEEQGLMR